MLKEKIEICSYVENCYEEEIVKIQDEEPIEVIGQVSSEKSAKKLTKELIEESDNESNKESNNESGNELIEESLQQIGMMKINLMKY